MATIDELSIEVETSAKKVDNSIDKVAKQLENLASATSKISASKLNSISVGLKNISKSLQGISNISNVSKALDKVKKSTDGLNGIKANIDTKNFDTAVEELQKRFKDSGLDFKFEGNSDQLEQTIKKLEKSLDKLYEKQDEFRDLGKNINTEGFIRLQRNIAVTSNRLDILKEQLEKVNKSSGNVTINRSVPKLSLGDYKKDLSQTKEDIKSIAEAFGGLKNIPKGMLDTPIQNLETSLRGLKESFPGATKEIGDFEKVLENLKKASSGLTRERIAPNIDTSAIGKMEETARSVENVRDSMKEAGLTAEQFEEYLENIRIPEIRETNLKKLQSELEKTEKKLEELTAKSDNWANKGINPDSSKFRNLQEQIVTTSRRADALRERIEEVGRTKPQVSGWQKLTTIASAIDKAFSAIKRGIKGALNSIKRLGNGFRNLHSIIKNISSAIGKMFRDITSLASKATSAIASSAKGISNIFSKLKGANSGIQGMTSNLENLAKAAGSLLAVKGIVNFGKEAVKLGSDITEVENVVDTAFGSMADKAYSFAETAKERFGLSELAAKQYSGTMMAMLKSSGIGQEAASNMSVTLAGLAGDIASFYNIDTEDAFKKLRSGIAGQTAPLKQLGINMNIANLESYAMSQGINKAYREMSLQEQTLLRYNYILAKTGDAQGDFARTAGTWANQTRLLKLNLQSLSAIIGQGLIAALLPAIKALNKFMEKLTQAAKKFRDFMYVLFGKKIESSARGVVDDMADMVDYNTDLSGIGSSAEDVADGMDDASDGMDSATGSAKKLEKALSVLGFDELNQLNKDLDDLDTSKVTGKKDKNKDLGLDDLGLGNADSMFDDLYDKKVTEPINEWARRIREAFLNHDWEGLGKVIAEMVNTGLKKIYDGIKTITPKVESALRAFAKVFNSFVKWLDWDLLGRTIGAGINLLARAFNALFGPGGIDLEQLGRKLSVGLRGMIDEVDWRGLGNAIGNYFMIAWRIASGFVEDMWRIDPEKLTTGWEEAGIALAEGVHGIFERINFKQIGETISGGFNGIIEIISSFRDRMASNHTWSKIAIGVSEGFNSIIDNIDLSKAAQEIGGLALDILHAMNQSAELTHWSEFGYKVAEGLFSVPWLQLFDNVFNFVSATFGEALGGFVNYLTTHAEELGERFAYTFNYVFDKIKYVTSNIPWDDIGKGISTFLNTSIAKIRPVEAAQNLGNFVTSLLGTMLQVAQGTDWNALGRLIGDFLVNIPWSEMIGQAFDIITNVFGGLITGLGGKILVKMPEIGTALAGGFNHAFETLKTFVDSMDGRWTEIGSTIATGLNNMITGIDWKTAGETFGRFIKGIIDTIFTVAKETDWAAFGRGIGDFLDGIPWLEILGKVAATIGAVVGEVIAGLFDTASGKFLLGFAGLKLLLKGVKLGNTALEIANDFAHKFGLLPEGVNLTIPKVVEGVKNLSEKFSPIIDKAKDVVTKVGEKLGFLPKGVTDAIPGISAGVEQIAGRSGLFSKILGGASSLVSKIGPVLGSIGSVIFSPQGLLIAGIAAGVVAVVMNWDKIKEAAGKVKDWVAEKWEGVKEKTSEIWGNVTEFLGNTWDNLKESASTIFGNIKDSISEKFEGIKETASNVWETVSSGLGNIWDSLKTKAGDIWGAITGKVSGANSEAESNTATTWGNTKENLSGNLSAMASSVTSVMSSINSVVSSSMAQISNTFLTGWQAIAGATGGVLRQTQSEVMMLMQSIKALIATSMQEIGSIFANGWRSVTAMSAVAIEQINATVTAKMMAMKSAIITLMQQIAGAFSSSWTAIGSMSIASTTRMLTDVNAKMTNMVHVVNTSMKAIGNAYTAGWKSSESATSSALSRMQSIVSSKMNAVQSTVSSKMNAVKNNVSSTMNSIQSTFQAKWTAIGNVVNQSLGKIQSTVTSKMNSIKSTVNTEMANIHNAFKGKWDSISNTCTQALNKMQSIVSSKMSVIKSTVSNSMSDIVSSYQNGMNKLPNITSNALTRAANELNKLPNRIGQSLNSNMLTAGQNAAISFANGIKSVYIPTPHIRVASWTQHRAGDSTYSTPNFGVNWYKSGGLAYKPSVVGIGEAGKEGILPLENKKTMGMIADSILDNYSGGAINEDMLANAVAEGVAMALMNNIDNLSSGNQQPINITVKLENDEAIARAAIRGQQSIDYRMNPTPLYGY